MKTLTLPCGRAVQMDDADFDRFGTLQWRSMRSAQKQDRYYVIRWAGKKNEYLHRVILAAPDDSLVDHVNGDGLDNRRVNLRLATRSQNNVNRTLPSGTGLRGVEIVRGKFRAHIRRDGKKRHLGIYPTLREAGLAYDKAAKAAWSDFARLNFSNMEES